MQTQRVLTFVATATMLAALVGLSAGGSAGAAPCRVQRDTSELAEYLIKQTLTYNDSAAIVALGLPFNPSSASIVSDSTTCQSIVNSYNAHLLVADSLLRITSGYVVRVGTAFGLYIPSTPDGPYRTELFALFNAAFQFRFEQVAIR